MLNFIKKEIIRAIISFLIVCMGWGSGAMLPEITEPNDLPNQAIEETVAVDPTITETDSTMKVEEESGKNETKPAVTPTQPEVSEKTEDKTATETKPVESVKPSEPPHSHVYGEKVVAPTCTKDGYTTYSCACGEKYNGNTVKALGHNYKSTVVAPTKSAEGYTNHVCSRCSESYKDNYVAKLPAVIFTNVNETVYANTTVNVRKGPGTSHEKLGTLTYGQSLTRTGIGDNGWSRVVYNGQEAYMFTNYIQTSKPVPPFDGSTPSADVAAKMAANADLVGIMYVPSVGMTPCPIYASRNGQDLQGLADASNSAYAVGIYNYPDLSVHKVEIGDHNNHNFSVNKNITAGTIGYINLGDRVLKMRCTSTLLNCSLTEYDANMPNDGDTIITITCSGQTGHRTINRWTVTEDSGVTFEEYYGMVTKYFKGSR